jgi:L-fuconolactonase
VNARFVFDSQVHAPTVKGLPERPKPPQFPYGSMGRVVLDAEMRRAGVARALLLPLGGELLETQVHEVEGWAEEEPSRWGVMGIFTAAEIDVAPGRRNDMVGRWKRRGVAAMRVNLRDEPYRSLLLADDLDWLWASAAQHDLPLTIFAPGLLEEFGHAIKKHPTVRVAIDHMGLTPNNKYTDDLAEPLADLLALAKHPNVGVKFSQLPRNTADPYPFRNLHTPIRKVIDAFGPARCFWGSDISTLESSYEECIGLFTDHLGLSDVELEAILGLSLCNWLEWPPNLALNIGTTGGE